jgi:hypothetical protein
MTSPAFLKFDGYITLQQCGVGRRSACRRRPISNRQPAVPQHITPRYTARPFTSSLYDAQL